MRNGKRQIFSSWQLFEASNKQRGFDNDQSTESVLMTSDSKDRVSWHRSAAAAISLVAFVAVPISAQAQWSLPSAPVAQAQNSTPAQLQEFWTAERLLNAKPFDLEPQLAVNGRPMAAMASPTPASVGTAVKVPGSKPSRSSDQSTSQVLITKNDIETHLAAHQTDAAVTPNSFSPIGATFTTSQVFPQDATTTYPYSTVGALFFSDDAGNYFCSASVIRPRVVATAGHCVATPHNASTGRAAHFHWNFYFVPAFRNGTAPFGVFTPYWATTTATWFYSDGSVPNAQDVGLLDMNDRNGYKLGEYVGSLGYWTGQLNYNNVTMLGYPCNLDGCEVLEANYAQTFEYGGNNTWIYGSNFGPGSSGCPYIRDFGWAPSGSLATEGGNWLIAVNSYGPINLGYLYSGASNLNDEFLGLVSSACSAGGC